MKAEQPRKVELAIAKLRSFHDGERGIVDVVACGEQATPALRTMLLEREPSGLYQARCRAVEALAAIGAHDVLIEFLKTERTIADPIERVGEDAVINAVALALAASASTLAKARERCVFGLLLRLAHRPVLSGVIKALSVFEDVEALPALIDALEEDGSRVTAEGALRRLGRLAHTELLRAVDVKVPSGLDESESSKRRRRSALRILAETDRSPKLWCDLRHLVHDNDAKVAALACEIGLARAAAPERAGPVRRLIELLAEADCVLRDEIEVCLVVHFNSAREMIAGHLEEVSRLDEDGAAKRQMENILRRVCARAQSVLQAR